MGFVGSNKSTDWYQPQPRSHSRIQYRQQVQCLNVQSVSITIIQNYPRKLHPTNGPPACEKYLPEVDWQHDFFYFYSVSIGPVLNQTTMEVGEFSSESPILSAVTRKQRRCVICQHRLCNDAIIKKKKTHASIRALQVLCDKTRPAEVDSTAVEKLTTVHHKQVVFLAM